MDRLRSKVNTLLFEFNYFVCIAWIFSPVFCVALTEIGDIIANEVPIEVMAINVKFLLFSFFIIFLLFIKLSYDTSLHKSTKKLPIIIYFK